MNEKQWDFELKQEKMHEKVIMAVGPIIEKIAVKTFPNKSPEELGQLLVHDYSFGNIMAGYYVRRDEAEIKESKTRKIKKQKHRSILADMELNDEIK